MPYAIRKIKNQDAYTVKNKETGKVHSHHTTKAKAKAQVRLLQSLGGMDIEMQTPKPRPEHLAYLERQETGQMGAEDVPTKTKKKQWEAVGETGEPVVAYTYQRKATPARRTNPYEWERNIAPIVEAVLPVENEEDDVMQQLSEMGVNRMFLLTGRVLQAISQVLPDTFESPYTQFRNASRPQKNRIASILQGVPVDETVYTPEDYPNVQGMLVVPADIVEPLGLEEKSQRSLHYGFEGYNETFNVAEDEAIRDFYTILKETIPDKASRIAFLKYTTPPIKDIMTLRSVPKEIMMEKILKRFMSIPDLGERIQTETNRIKREGYKRRAQRAKEARDLAITERVQAERGREGSERTSMSAEDTGAGEAELMGLQDTRTKGTKNMKKQVVAEVMDKVPTGVLDKFLPASVSLKEAKDSFKELLKDRDLVRIGNYLDYLRVNNPQWYIAMNKLIPAGYLK